MTVYDGYMGKPANHLATCAMCGKQEDSRAMIEAYRSDRIDPDQVCVSCWSKRGEKPVQPRPEVPADPHPLASLAASAHKTQADAMARADKVAYHLGKRPEIHPLEPDAPAYWVVGDSPLVPGFKPGWATPSAGGGCSPSAWFCSRSHRRPAASRPRLACSSPGGCCRAPPPG
jgi:hypothetical protein